MDFTKYSTVLISDQTTFVRFCYYDHQNVLRATSSVVTVRKGSTGSAASTPGGAFSPMTPLSPVGTLYQALSQSSSMVKVKICGKCVGGFEMGMGGGTLSHVSVGNTCPELEMYVHEIVGKGLVKGDDRRRGQQFKVEFSSYCWQR